jgi:hypothetical protein
MASSGIESDHKYGILTLEEVARNLHKSKTWVYKNWRLLDGRKLGGSLIFPRKEDLYEHLFHKGQGVEVRLHPQRLAPHQVLVQNQGRSQAGRGPKKGGTEKPAVGSGDPNRHGILGAA